MAPAEVTAETEAEALNNLHGSMKPQADRGRLVVGDTVRISGGTAPFMKGYKGRWTEELFRIQAIKKTAARPFSSSWTCPLRSLGSFSRTNYKRSMNRTIGKWKQFANHAGSDRRGAARVKQHLVKWFGYPESMNSWVDASSVKQTAFNNKSQSS